MPAAAVARLTPAIAGISGTSVGESGETEEDMSWIPIKTWMPGTKAGHDVKLPKSVGEVDLLLGGRHHLVVVGLGGGGFRRLVHALDLGGFAELRHVIRLCLAGHVGLDLA